MSVANLLEISFASLAIQKEITHCLSKLGIGVGLSVQELQVLWIIAGTGGSVPLDITARTGYGERELLPVLEGLEAEGLITKVRCSSSYKLLFVPTERGGRLIRHVANRQGLRHSCDFVSAEAADNFIEAAGALIRVLRGYGTLDMGAFEESGTV